MRLRHVAVRALVLGLALVGGAPAAAQIAGPAYVFVNGTTIEAAEVNTNFATIYANALNRTGGTMTGALLFSADNAHDIGATGTTRPRDLNLARNAIVGGTLAVTGASTFTGAATFAGAVAANGVLTVTGTTAPQFVVRYDASNHLDLSISSTGGATFNAVGTGAALTFSDDATFSGNIAMTGVTLSMSSVNPVAKWVETDGAANGQRYRVIANGGSLIFQACTDADVCTTAFSYPNVAGAAEGVIFGVPVRASAGAVGAPSLSFASDADTGFYNASANTMVAAVGGAAAFTVGTTGTFFSARVEAAGPFALAEVAFGSLPGVPNDGDMYFCNNCSIANPCNGAGTGAIAKRLNGVWVCN